MPQRVGVIGLGIMGAPMARNLLKAGFQVAVFNRTRSRMEELVKEGARPAASPREVAERSDVTITMVTDSPDVEQVILGPGGAVEGAGQGAVVADMSTISPRVTREIAARLKERGAHMLDAPVSGGQWGAINATLSIMAGGERDVFERSLPVFQALGKTITYCGGHGMGQVTKLVNQVLVANTLNGVAEALVFAAKAGADLEATLQAVGGGAAGSWQLANLGPRILKGDFAPGFMVKLQQKDLRLVLEAAREMNLPLPATGLVHQLYAALEAEGRGGEGTQALVKVHEKLAGVEARAKRS